MTPEARPSALVVDDDEHLACLLQLLLERAGYAAQVLHDGAAAKAFIAQEPPVAVALLDVMLPFHDGPALVQAMRATPGWERVPAILLTPKSQDNPLASALAAGADGCIAKPVEPAKVLACVERLAKLAPHATPPAPVAPVAPLAPAVPAAREALAA